MREVQARAYGSEDVGDVLLGTPDAVGDEAADARVADALVGSVEAKAAWPLYGDFEAGVKEGVASQTEVQPRILVVVGELDRVEPEAAVRERAVRVWEDAGARVEGEKSGGVGHLIPVEAPGMLGKRVKAFLESIGVECCSSLVSIVDMMQKFSRQADSTFIGSSSCEKRRLPSSRHGENI